MLPTKGCQCQRPLHIQSHQASFAIECHFCKEWFHGDCVGVTEHEALQILQFACPNCKSDGHQDLLSSSTYPSTYTEDHTIPYMPWLREGFQLAQEGKNSNNKRFSIHNLYKKNSSRFFMLLKAAIYSKHGLIVVPSQNMTASYFYNQPFDFPIKVTEDSPLYPLRNTPYPALTTDDITNILASGTQVRSLDVGTQESFNLSIRGWTRRLSNISSDLENSSNSEGEENLFTAKNAQFSITDTFLNGLVSPPPAVKAISWRHKLCDASPSNPILLPDVSCIYATLFGENTFQDFTLHTNGKSVWLTVTQGELFVYLIPPSAENWKKYEMWKTSSTCTTDFLVEKVQQCIRTALTTVSTILIPAGWIYAFYSEKGCTFFHEEFWTTLTLKNQLHLLLVDEEQSPSLSRSQLSRHNMGEHIASVSVDAARPLTVLYDVQNIGFGWPTFQVMEEKNNNNYLTMIELIMSVMKFYLDELKSTHDSAVLVTPEECRVLLSCIPLISKFGNNTPEYIKDSKVVQSIISSNFLNELKQLLIASSIWMYNYSNDLTPIPYIDIKKHVYTQSNDIRGINSGQTSLQHFGQPFPVMGKEYFHHSPSESVDIDQTTQMFDRFWETTSSIDTIPGSLAAISFDRQSSSYPLSPGSIPDDTILSLQRNESYISEGSLSYETSATQGYNFTQQSFTDLQFSHPAPTAMADFTATNDEQSKAMLRNLGDPYNKRRASCHRCGNLRKTNVACVSCPHIFCRKCAEKMLDEHGKNIFVNGCPVCKELCCCGRNRSLQCSHKYHCYKKCPKTKLKPTE